MVVAQDQAHAGQGILPESASLLILPQVPQGDGKAVGKAQGIRVVRQSPRTVETWVVVM